MFAHLWAAARGAAPVWRGYWRWPKRSVNLLKKVIKMANKAQWTSASQSQPTRSNSKDWVFGWTLDQTSQSAARLQPSDPRPNLPGGSPYGVLVPSERSYHSR